MYNGYNTPRQNKNENSSEFLIRKRFTGAEVRLAKKAVF